MAPQSLQLEQARAFMSWLSDRPYTRSVELKKPATVVANVPRDAYHDVSSAAYQFGMKPAKKRDVHSYTFEPGDVEGAERGPASRY